MKLLSVGMMLIRFNGITDANILIYANDTNKKQWCSEALCIISIISIHSYIGIGLTHSCIDIIY